MASSFLLLFALFVFGIIVVFGLSGKLLNYYRLCQKISKIPGQPAHWLFGNLAQFRMTDKARMEVREWRMENKVHLNRVWIGPFEVGIELAHPRLIKKLLNEPKSEVVYAMLEPWLGQGLLVANGKRWHRSRRLLTPAFHFDILKPYVHVYNECTKELLGQWQKCADAGKPVNICETSRKLTLDVLLQCACSYESGCQKAGCNDPYVAAVEELVILSADRFVSLVLRANEFFYMYCTPSGWKYRSAMGRVHKHSDMIIAERKKSLLKMDDQYQKKSSADILKLLKSSKKMLDFLDVLLAAQDENGLGMTDREVRYEVDTFMYEGHDTTGNSIIFTLYLLARHPEHQEKCREEVRDVLRGRDTFDYEDLSKLQYLTWCLKEALRVYSPVSMVFRRVTQDVELDGYVIPKDTWVNLDLQAIHQNPEVWEKPFEFNPERFDPENFKTKEPYSYVPFSAGPRNCIGQNFALDEERVVIGSILNRFNLELTTDEEIETIPKVVSRPTKDIFLKLTTL